MTSPTRFSEAVLSAGRVLVLAEISPDKGARRRAKALLRTALEDDGLELSDGIVGEIVDALRAAAFATAGR